MPAGQENERRFSQSSAIPYHDAYKIIDKQMRHCFRVITWLGNGLDVQAELDKFDKKGTIELYSIGLGGPSKPEESGVNVTVSIFEAAGNGSTIVTTGSTGTVPLWVYRVHKGIPAWLDGVPTCALQSK